jgi:lysozyme
MALALAACGVGGGPDDRRSTSSALRACASQVVEGIDVFDGQGAIDWGAVKADGVAFALIKATQGTYNTQATFAFNWSGAKAAGLRRGAYHFFDPTEDGVAQAEHFLAVTGPPAPDDLPPMLDVECPDGSPTCLGSPGSGEAAASSLASDLHAFLGTVEDATGKRPLLYTFNAYFRSAGVDAAGLEAYPLVIAYPTDGGCFEVPSPWVRATFWQYSWSGSVGGIGPQVSRDRFLGTAQGLDALTLVEPAPDAGPDDGPAVPRLEPPAFGPDATFDGDGSGEDGASEDALTDAPGDLARSAVVDRAEGGCSLDGRAASGWDFEMPVLAGVLALVRRRQPRLSEESPAGRRSPRGTGHCSTTPPWCSSRRWACTRGRCRRRRRAA